MKYDQKFRAMKVLLGVKIGFKSFFFFLFTSLGETEVKKESWEFLVYIQV